jgi:hypothetical protein
LNPIEQLVLVTLANGYFVGDITVLQSDFYDFWATVDEHNNVNRRQAFINVYRMILTVCDNGEGEFVPCYLLGGNFWNAFTIFALSPESICLELCPELLFPQQH